MSSRDYFVVGCKVVGIYCIFLSIAYLVHAVGTFFYPADLSPDMAWSLFVDKAVIRIIPIVDLTLGIYLLMNGRVIHNIAYPQTHDNDTSITVEDVTSQGTCEVLSITSKLILAFQFAGLYLVITNFHDLLKTSSYLFTRSQISTVYSMPSLEKVTTYSQFLSSLGGTILGIYLLKPSNVLIRLALREPPKSDVNDESDYSSTE